MSVGFLLVVSSPSGAGKTTLCQRLLRSQARLRFSVSYTTRPPRVGEIQGGHYHFVSTETFEDMVQKGRFAEWAFVHGNRYGTAIDAIQTAMDAGNDVLCEIDYQGALNLKKQFGQRVLLVYILPPSMKVLKERLYARGTEDDATILRRLAKAKEEISHYVEYDFLVVNQEVDTAYRELEASYLWFSQKMRPELELSNELEQLAKACSLDERAHKAQQLLLE